MDSLPSGVYMVQNAPDRNWAVTSDAGDYREVISGKDIGDNVGNKWLLKRLQNKTYTPHRIADDINRPGCERCTRLGKTCHRSEGGSACDECKRMHAPCNLARFGRGVHKKPSMGPVSVEVPTIKRTKRVRSRADTSEDEVEPSEEEDEDSFRITKRARFLDQETDVATEKWEAELMRMIRDMEDNTDKMRKTMREIEKANDELIAFVRKGPKKWKGKGKRKE